MTLETLTAIVVHHCRCQRPTSRALNCIIVSSGDYCHHYVSAVYLRQKHRNHVEMVPDTFTHLLVGVHIDPYLCVSMCICACEIVCECT